MNAPLTSRGPLGLIAAALAGGLSAAFLVIAFRYENAPLLPLAAFTPLPLYLAGLGTGVLGAFVAVLSAALILFSTKPLVFGFGFTLAVGLPAIGASMLALRHRIGDDQKVHWYPEGKVLMAFTLYPCVFFLLAVFPLWLHLINVADIAYDKLNPIAPAAVSYLWIFVTMICFAGAQYILQREGKNLRDKFAITAIRAPSWLIYAIAGIGILCKFGNAPYDYIARNIVLILGLPFILVGIGIVHYYCMNIRMGTPLLILFYCALIFIWPPLALLGVIDQWADFRQRIAQRTKPV